MTPNSGIDLIKRALPLSEYIGRFSGKVKRSGSSTKFMALCPLHDNNNSPAMSIVDKPEGGLWKCFAGCGGGSIIDFWILKEGLDPKDPGSFKLAIESLGKELNVTLPEYKADKETGPSKSRVTAALGLVARKANKALLKDEDSAAYTYLTDRGFTRGMIEDYLIGFLPSGSNNALAFVKRATDDMEALRVGSVVHKNVKDDSYWVAMHGRITVPIFDARGHVIGFGARVVPGVESHKSEDAKWLNSNESPIYQKSRVLYGIDQGIKGKDVVVSEGYFDAIALDLSDVCGLASCGTAFTADHLQTLEGAKSVTLLFDGDDAGMKALSRSVWSLNHRSDIHYGILEEGKDPFEVVVENRESLTFTSGPLAEGAAKAQWAVSESPEKFDKWVSDSLSGLHSTDSRNALIAEGASLRGIAKNTYSRQLTITSVRKSDKIEKAAPFKAPIITAILALSDEAQASIVMDRETAELVIDSGLFSNKESRSGFLRVLCDSASLSRSEVEEGDSILSDCLPSGGEPFPRVALEGLVTRTATAISQALQVETQSEILPRMALTISKMRQALASGCNAEWVIVSCIDFLRETLPLLDSEED